MEKLEWNVYKKDFNKSEIEIFNIFNHSRFYEDLCKCNKENYEEFKKEVKSNLMYYFWSKSEYEIIITSFPPYIDKKEIEKLTKTNNKIREAVNLDTGKKIDIFDQIMINQDKFIDYLWNNKKLLKKNKNLK